MKRVSSKNTRPSVVTRQLSWTERELRLVDRLATIHEELDVLHKERAALIAYVSRLHAGSVTPPDSGGWRVVHVDTAAGKLSWRVAPEDTELLGEAADSHPADSAASGTYGDTVTRLSFLHLHRRPNRTSRHRRQPSG